VLGRFLEHSRVLRFGNGDDPDEFWIGSADLMHRNLDRRVEALVEVTDPAARTELERVLDLMMAEDTCAFELSSDGTWLRITGDADLAAFDPQTALLRRIVGRSEPLSRASG
jgi:polyphosphate kinase